MSSFLVFLSSKDSMANNTDEILNHAVHFRNQIREIALGIGKHDSQVFLINLLHSYLYLCFFGIHIILLLY